MAQTLERLAQFLFVIAVPLLVVGGGLATLFLVGAIFDALDHPDQLRSRIEALFRREPRAPRRPGPEHYYKPYWEGPRQS